jgi:hypothetical protein
MAMPRKVSNSPLANSPFKYDGVLDLALRLGLPFWVYTINKPLAFLSLLFIRICRTATAGYVYVVNFDHPPGNRLFIQLPRDAIGCEFNLVPYHNLMVPILCFDWVHDTILSLMLPKDEDGLYCRGQSRLKSGYASGCPPARPGVGQ